MWENIEETVCRATGNIVYGIWGPVGVSIDYEKDTKEVALIVWDKSYRRDDKKVVVDKKFKIDLETTSEIRVKHDLIANIEEYLLENYS